MERWQEIGMAVLGETLAVVATVVILAAIAAVPIGLGMLLLHWAGVL